jgi:hypothetical protein
MLKLTLMLLVTTIFVASSRGQSRGQSVPVRKSAEVDARSFTTTLTIPRHRGQPVDIHWDQKPAIGPGFKKLRLKGDVRITLPDKTRIVVAHGDVRVDVRPKTMIITIRALPTKRAP